MFITPHSMIAEICLTYLDFQSVCDLSSTLRKIPTTTPFLHYASCYWGLHARKEMTERVKSPALRLLQKDANHISAQILHREESVGFLSSWDRWMGVDPDLTGYSGLHCITYMGVSGTEIAMVSMKRWDLNGPDSKGVTPLMWASKYGNHSLAKLLLEQGDVNPNLSNRCSRTALLYAVKVGSPKLVKLLLAREDLNPELSGVNGRTPLSWAAGYGTENVIKLLLNRAGVNPDSLDILRRTPISYATESGKEGVVKLLLEHEGVNPDSLDNYGHSSSSYAARGGHRGILNLLLQRGAINPDASRNDFQSSPFFCQSNVLDSAVNQALRSEQPNPDPSPPSHHSQPAPHLPATSPQEAEIYLSSRREDNIPDSRLKTPEDFPLPHSDEPPSNPLIAPRPAPILTPTTDSDTVPESAITTPPRSLKRSLQVIHQTPKRKTKRKNLRSS